MKTIHLFHKLLYGVSSNETMNQRNEKRINTLGWIFKAEYKQEKLIV